MTSIFHFAQQVIKQYTAKVENDNADADSSVGTVGSVTTVVENILAPDVSPFPTQDSAMLVATTVVT